MVVTVVAVMVVVGLSTFHMEVTVVVELLTFHTKVVVPLGGGGGGGGRLSTIIIQGVMVVATRTS